MINFIIMMLHLPILLFSGGTFSLFTSSSSLLPDLTFSKFWRKNEFILIIYFIVQYCFVEYEYWWDEYRYHTIFLLVLFHQQHRLKKVEAWEVKWSLFFSITVFFTYIKWPTFIKRPVFKGLRVAVNRSLTIFLMRPPTSLVTHISFWCWEPTPPLNFSYFLWGGRYVIFATANVVFLECF